MVEKTQRLIPAAVLALVVLSGCVSGGGTMRAGDVSGAGSIPDGQSDAAVAPRPETGPVPAASAPAPRNSAAVALQAQAAGEIAAGDLEQAASTLERAVRIEPDDAELWLALARLRLDQGRHQLAGELARRAESLARPDSGVRRQARDVQQQAATAGGRQ